MLLVDFPDSVVEAISRDLEVVTAKTRWNDPAAPSIPYEDHSLVLFYAAYSDQAAAGLHVSDRPRVKELLARGGLIIYFVTGQCQRFHITNILGDLPWLQLTGALQPAQQILPTQVEPFLTVFSSYSHRIVTSIGLLPLQYSDIRIAEDRCRQIGLTPLAFFRAQQFHPVSLMARLDSAGAVIFMPLFANDVLPLIVSLVLDQIVPAHFPHLHEPATDSWLDDARYQMPQVLELIEKRKAMSREFTDKLRLVDEEIARTKLSEQEPFNLILLSSGDALKDAVAEVLRYIGLYVADVDEYWQQKDPSREKEEDLWVATQEFDPRGDSFCLAEITSEGRGTASDDHCGRIVRYLLRRRNEFSNNRIRGLLIINHQYRLPPHLRRPPYSHRQINDAIRDGNGLTTTYELFKAVKAEKAGRMQNSDIRNALLTQSGFIEFGAV